MQTARSQKAFDPARLDATLRRTFDCWHVGPWSFELEILADIDAAVAETFKSWRGDGRDVVHSTEVAPHFGVMWPAGLHLAWWLYERFDQSLSSAERPPASVLELGCGLGLPSLVLAKMGLPRVVASDRHELAGRMLQRNARRMEIDLQFVPADWRVLVDSDDPPHTHLLGHDLIIASDVLYEPWQSGYLAAAINKLAGSSTEVVVADAGRRWFPQFVQALDACGFLCRSEELSSLPLANIGERRPLPPPLFRLLRATRRRP